MVSWNIFTTVHLWLWWFRDSARPTALWTPSAIPTSRNLQDSTIIYSCFIRLYALGTQASQLVLSLTPSSRRWAITISISSILGAPAVTNTVWRPSGFHSTRHNQDATNPTFGQLLLNFGLAMKTSGHTACGKWKCYNCWLIFVMTSINYKSDTWFIAGMETCLLFSKKWRWLVNSWRCS